MLDGTSRDAAGCQQRFPKLKGASSTLAGTASQFDRYPEREQARLREDTLEHHENR
jgi:hypothetical protein